jgi:hypothetical protein
MNGVYDQDEAFNDVNGDGVWNSYCKDLYEEFCDNYLTQELCEDSGQSWVQEDFIDGNGIYDEGEYFTDALNGFRNEDEGFIDALNGVYDEGEEFTDGNGVYDEGEEFIDIGNCVWDEGCWDIIIEEWKDDFSNQESCKLLRNPIISFSFTGFLV